MKADPKLDHQLSRNSHQPSSATPSRALVNLSFWLTHIAGTFGVLKLAYSPDPSVSMTVIVSLVTAAIASFVYILAIGLYVQKFNRTGVAWSAVAFFTSPLGIWGTYLALFVLGEKLWLPPRKNNLSDN